MFVKIQKKKILRGGGVRSGVGVGEVGGARYGGWGM